MLRPFTFALSGMIGRQEFDKAIDYLRSRLKGNASDLSYLEMIAQCHNSAGRSDEAIKACHAALRYDAKSFEMHSLLAQLLAEKGLHDDAAIHARVGLENYPEPVEVPGFALAASNALVRLFPRLRAAALDEGLRSIETEHKNWFDWAKRYLTWYDLTYGDRLGPTKH